MSWNVNSLVKDNFQRGRLIEVELPNTLLSDYTFVPANNPANNRNCGVGLFYKNSLPVIVRTDLSFDESIVVELKFGFISKSFFQPYLSSISRFLIKL